MKNSAMSCRNREPEHAVGDRVERLRGGREQPRPVRHGEPAQQPRLEELLHPSGCVEHVERAARRRRVDHDQVVPPRRVQLVELLHRQVVVAVDEAARDVDVERVRQHRLTNLGVRCVAADELVPARLGVEHRGPQLAARLDTGRCERVVGHPRRGVPERTDAERVGKAARRIDGQHEHPPAEVGRRRRRHAPRPSSSCRLRPSRTRAPSPWRPASRRGQAHPSRAGISGRRSDQRALRRGA